MAAALLVLTVANAACTGWLLCRVRVMSRVIAKTGDIVQDLVKSHEDLEARVPDVWDGSRG